MRGYPRCKFTLSSFRVWNLKKSNSAARIWMLEKIRSINGADEGLVLCTDIYSSNGIAYPDKLYNVKDVRAKMMCLTYNDEIVLIPILHYSMDQLNKEPNKLWKKKCFNYHQYFCMNIAQIWALNTKNILIMCPDHTNFA